MCYSSPGWFRSLLLYSVFDLPICTQKNEAAVPCTSTSRLESATLPSSHDALIRSSRNSFLHNASSTMTKRLIVKFTTNGHSSQGRRWASATAGYGTERRRALLVVVLEPPAPSPPRRRFQTTSAGAAGEWRRPVLIVVSETPVPAPLAKGVDHSSSPL